MKKVMLDLVTLVTIFVIMIDLFVLVLMDFNNNYWWGIVLNGVMWVLAIYFLPKDD